ncbi:FHA domain-containing protein [Stenomitos frigidus]|uniref:Phosphopeptide-binding protein n=1 Tax=Stenomitos frigidus ULC18 TaxID=2107698 RepID=A0A2T1E9C6_9CYAN|nr:FHA domain-containing protein [Stenomitos frigidus]PSB29330.1 phosphopeptide-binding protein [Stenomitos frigidus ULC18]
MSSEPYQSHLLIVEDDNGRRGVVLDGSEYSIGRDPTCDICLESLFVSRRHATLLRLPNGDGTFSYRIVDGDLEGRRSSNGFLVNGYRLRTHNLQNEDEVVFGPQVRAIYYLCHRDAVLTEPSDEFDITLISPGMIGDTGPNGQKRHSLSLPISLQRQPPRRSLLKLRRRRLFG